MEGAIKPYFRAKKTQTVRPGFNPPKEDGGGDNLKGRVRLSTRENFM
jgi:hypothetical protein